ncbi:MAG: hypothetical protein VSS75_025660 [Candidatus Parabeggiatoa sp.]|nr:hypothetical protein [Candidatus Parabeggiatoa sp.]
MPVEGKELMLHIVYQDDGLPYEVQEPQGSTTVYDLQYAQSEQCNDATHRTVDGSTFAHSHILYDLPEDGVIESGGQYIPVTANVANINPYWEFEGDKPPAGQFAPSKGYRKIKEVNVKYNCVAHALGYTTAWIEPGDKDQILSKDYTQIDRDLMEDGKQYVLCGSTHCVQIVQVNKTQDAYTLNEKNAESGVYEKTYTRAQLDEQFSEMAYNVYKKK